MLRRAPGDWVGFAFRIFVTRACAMLRRTSANGFGLVPGISIVARTRSLEESTGDGRAELTCATSGSDTKAVLPESSIGATSEVRGTLLSDATKEACVAGSDACSDPSTAGKIGAKPNVCSPAGLSAARVRKLGTAIKDAKQTMRVVMHTAVNSLLPPGIARLRRAKEREARC